MWDGGIVGLLDSLERTIPQTHNPTNQQEKVTTNHTNITNSLSF